MAGALALMPRPSGPRRPPRPSQPGWTSATRTMVTASAVRSRTRRRRNHRYPADIQQGRPRSLLAASTRIPCPKPHSSPRRGSVSTPTRRRFGSASPPFRARRILPVRNDLRKARSDTFSAWKAISCMPFERPDLSRTLSDNTEQTGAGQSLWRMHAYSPHELVRAVVR